MRGIGALDGNIRYPFMIGYIMDGVVGQEWAGVA